MVQSPIGEWSTGVGGLVEAQKGPAEWTLSHS